MTRVSEIHNTSNSDIKVKLTSGPEITLPPNSGIKNADVENIGTLRGQVQVTEDLTEVNLGQGKTRIDG